MSPLSFSKVTFSYKSHTPILKNISFEVNPTEIVGIIGPNGSGKSTLIKLGNGLLNPKSGSIMLNGSSIMKERTSKLAHDIVVMLQFTRQHFFMSTVEQELLITLKQHIDEKSKYLSRLDYLLEKFELKDKQRFHPYVLSGGEQRRLALAIALAGSADYFLLDEPTANLDQETRLLLIDTLLELKKNGKGIVIVSHDIEFQLSLCDRVLVLLEGKIEFEGSPYELIKLMKEKDWSFFQIPEIFLFVNSLERKLGVNNLLSNYFKFDSIDEKVTMLSKAFMVGEYNEN